jgi:predicted SPOUT superfamily RNA methylase MTH1
VDEVVLYGDPSVKGGRGNWDPTHFFARLLQYVETPQYLRKVRQDVF